MANTIRTFIAIPLPPAILDQLAMLQRTLEAQLPPRSVRWVQARSIHLTLKFLGDTPVEQLPEIKQALAIVARNAPACSFAVEGLGCFPNMRRPNVIWVGIQEPTGRLIALQDAIEEAVAPFGYPPEGRGFSPHLTLGRVQRKGPRHAAAQVGQVVASTPLGQLAEVSADRFALIRSVLKPSGAEYTPLAEFLLHTP